MSTNIEQEIENLRKEAAEAEKRAQTLKEKLAALDWQQKQDRLVHLRPLAERAHGLLCMWNHTDGCSWGYEQGSWDGQAHRRWLGKIDALIHPPPPYQYSSTEPGPARTVEDVEAVLTMVEELRLRVPDRALWVLDALRRN